MCFYECSKHKRCITIWYENIQGTARFQSMGGAFGALGGDLSSLNINPAGAAVFNNTLVTFSGTFFATDNQVNYFGTQTNSNVSDTNINQVGGVFVFNNTNSNSDWKKFSLAFNYDLARNFENSYLFQGRSNQGVDSYFLNLHKEHRSGPFYCKMGN